MTIDRREFIKRSAAISATAALGPGILNFVTGSGCTPIPRPALTESEIKAVLETALKRGGDFSEVFIEEIASVQFKISEGKFSDATAGISNGIGVRTVDGDKNGYSYANGYDYQRTLEAAEASSYIASTENLVKVAEPVNLALPGTITIDTPVQRIAESRKMELVRKAEAAARSFSPLVKQVDISYYDQNRKRTIANSTGTRVENEIPLIWVVIEVLAEKNGVRHNGRKRLSAHQGYEFFDLINIEEAAREAAREAVTMLDAKPAPSGVMPVVLFSGWGGVLIHEAVGHGLEGDAVYREMSIYSGKVGEKVASDLVTMIDDSSWPNARGTTEFDDEGTIGQRNVLIENGVLKKYMNDLISAKMLNESPTGNGRRDNFRSYPLPRMTNTFLDNGDTNPDDIIADTPNGVFVRALSGGSVDTVSGQFNFVVREAYMIENGKVTYPVSGATLIGKGIDVLTNIDAVGNDLDFGVGTCGKGQWVPVTAGQPTTRIIKGITVGGTA